MATKKFYENYDHIVTPTSKNIVLEYNGDSSVYFGITVDISGKNATKYSSYYENVSVKSGDDLIVKTIFISNSGSAKTVTTTVKDYFTNEYFDNNLVLESNLLKNQTYTINQNTEIGTNGLYMEKGDFASSDFILAPKYDYEESFKLNDIRDDFVYDEKGEDNYVIASSSGRDYFLEMSGNDKYSASNSSNPHIQDLKGNDEYVAEKPDTRMNIDDYSGNDKYEAKDSATIITYDYKGNDEYIAQDNGSLLIEDYKGNDKYWFWSHSASFVVDAAGNDSYDLLNAIMDDPHAKLYITDNKGNDKFSIKNSSNINIIESSGADKYEILNGSNAVSLQDDSGNDKYIIKNIDTSSTEITVSNFTIKDSLGNDKYELANVKSKYGQALSSITDKLGNDKYTVNDSNYFEFLEHSGKDTYNLIGTEENKVSNFYITDYAGNDKYTLEHINKVHYEDQEPDKSSIVEKQGNDSYSIKETRNLIITDELGNDKYTLEEKHSNLSITDKSGKDTYKSKKGVFLSCTYIFDSGTDNDTYSLSGFSTGAIEDEGGNNKFDISDSYGFSIDAIGQGNDKYTLQNQINGYIKDYDGKDTYTSKGKTTLWELSITDSGTAADTYTLTGGNLLSITDEGGNNKFTISNCSESGITATGNGNDTYKYTNMYDCWIEDYDGNDNYNINKSWLSIIEDYAGSDVYKFTNTESGYITDNDGNDIYNLKNCYDIKITDESGDDRYTIDIKGIKNGHHYIADYVSDSGDTLTIKGLSTKNIMYLSDYDKDGNCSGDMIIFDKSSKSYIQIDSFFNYSTEFNTFEGDFEYGQIETIKVGGKKLDIDAMEMSTYLDNISLAVASWLSSNSCDNICKFLNESSEEEIGNFIAYMTEQ